MACEFQSLHFSQAFLGSPYSPRRLLHQEHGGTLGAEALLGQWVLFVLPMPDFLLGKFGPGYIVTPSFREPVVERIPSMHVIP